MSHMSQWVTCFFITMNIGIVVSFLSRPHAPASCCKDALELHICNNVIMYNNVYIGIKMA